jgi:hypothetical protein
MLHRRSLNRSKYVSLGGRTEERSRVGRLTENHAGPPHEALEIGGPFARKISALLLASNQPFLFEYKRRADEDPAGDCEKDADDLGKGVCLQ